MHITLQEHQRQKTVCLVSCQACNWHLFSIFLTVIFPPTVSCLPQVCSFSCSLLNLGQAIQEQYRKNIKQRKHNIRNIRNWILKTKYSKNKFVTTITVITVTPITISWAQITQFLFGFVVCVVLEFFGLIGILFFLTQVSWFTVMYTNRMFSRFP